MVPESADAGRENARENNSNTFTGSTVNGSAVVAGSRASVRVSTDGAAGDRRVADAVADLKRELAATRAALDRRDDETREALVLASDRLSQLEDELQAPSSERDPSRITRLMTGIRDSVAGLATLATSVGTLWSAVQQLVR